MSQLSDSFPTLGALYKQALCSDLPTEIWFPVEEDEDYEEKIIYAKEVCAACPVLVECQTHAIKNEEFGIWGGMTEKERRSTRRRRSNR